MLTIDKAFVQARVWNEESGRDNLQVQQDGAIRFAAHEID